MSTRQFQALELPLEELDISSANVRRDVGDISELADSIREQGILEPLIVRPTTDGRYEVIIGSRRLAAAKQVGLSLVPVIVQEISDSQAVVRSLVENLQRGDLTLEERVEAYKRLQELSPSEFADTRNLARTTGRAHVKIVQDFEAYETLVRLRPKGIGVVAQLPPTAAERRSREAIPEGHATMLEQAIAAVRGRLPEEQVDSAYEELAKTIAPLEQDRARRVLDYFKMYPERTPPELEAMALATVRREITLPAETARRLEEIATREGGRNLEDAITHLVETAPRPIGEPPAQVTEPSILHQLPLGYQHANQPVKTPAPPRYEVVELPEAPMSVQLTNKVVWNLVHLSPNADFYTIGYGGRDLDQFLEILTTVGVATLVDVRHSPVSPYKPDFSRLNLENALAGKSITYVHRGDLGVPREVRERAASAGSREEIWEWYHQNTVPMIAEEKGKTLVDAYEQPVAFMCGEVDPTACHRHQLFLALERAELQGFDL